ncbi:MAG: TRL-like family protein [Paludibacteraceae bacterium]|nr:TRL-like family protein [Paludibacteraceae bacterium]
MKKLFLTSVLASVIILFSSCGAVGLVGALYTGVTTPEAVTSNEVGSKVGTAKATSILGLIAVGNGGVNKAAKEAGITKISHVDVKTVSVLGIFTTQKYFVYGE